MFLLNMLIIFIDQLNNRQSVLDEELNERFKQLDIQNVKISKVEGIMESYREEVNYLKSFCQRLDICKTEATSFEDLSVQFEVVTRQIKINHDLLVDKVTNLENFCDKYIPLISQNIVCDTLTQVVNSKEKKRLEIYEHKVYMKLHETLLSDEGSPDIEGHRNALLKQINDKLTILTRIINERRYLIPKNKEETEVFNNERRSSISKKQNHYKEIAKSKRSSSIKRVDFNEKDGTLQMKEYKMQLNPELEKEIQRAEEAEKAIREMEANKGMLNYHRISEKELMDIGSIESSNVDYAEIFEEKISTLTTENERINKRINYMMEVISNSDKTLREIVKKSVSEVQEYVYSLHREIDLLTDKILKEKSTPQISEELLKQIASLKCKCEVHNNSETNRSNRSINHSMLLPNKNLKAFQGEELPTLPNSNYLSFRINTPESHSSHKTKLKQNKKIEEYENFVNSEIPASHK